MSEKEMARFRIEYEQAGLDERDLDPDPFVMFDRWFADAAGAGISEPNAMVVATVGRDGQPTARTILLKEVRDRQFVFFTNYGSRKGEELAVNPRIGLLFAWVPIHRQVRIDGFAERIPGEESDRYFASRPPGARIGGAASPQSRPIPDRAWLEERVRAVESEYPEGNVPRPDHWGGYAVTPTLFEFWQGRPNRLHDRIRYRPEKGWVADRLAP
jgi:pyridoxamine 5'-phosphate oxidase